MGPLVGVAAVAFYTAAAAHGRVKAGAEVVGKHVEGAPVEPTAAK